MIYDLRFMIWGQPRMDTNGHECDLTAENAQNAERIGIEAEICGQKNGAPHGFSRSGVEQKRTK